MSDEAKAKILEFIKSKSKAKSKFYMNDLRKAVPEMTKKDVKKVVSDMIEDGTLMYYSTGSTTMIQLAEEDIDSKLK